MPGFPPGVCLSLRGCSVQVSVSSPLSTTSTPTWPARSRACCWRLTTRSCCSCWSPQSPSTPRWAGAWGQRGGLRVEEGYGARRLLLGQRRWVFLLIPAGGGGRGEPGKGPAASAPPILCSSAGRTVTGSCVLTQPRGRIPPVVWLG